MLRFLADENFNGDVLRGLRLRRPDIDLLRVQDVGLEQAEDPAGSSPGQPSASASS